jgi:hypothetical protein
MTEDEVREICRKEITALVIINEGDGKFISYISRAKLDALNAVANAARRYSHAAVTDALEALREARESKP